MTQKKYPDELRGYSTSPFTTADPIRLRRRHIRRLQGRLYGDALAEAPNSPYKAEPTLWSRTLTRFRCHLRSPPPCGPTGRAPPDMTCHPLASRTEPRHPSILAARDISVWE